MISLLQVASNAFICQFAHLQIEIQQSIHAYGARITVVETQIVQASVVDR